MAAASARGSARLRTSSSPTIDPDGIPTAYTVWLVSTGVPNRQYTSAAYSRTVPDTITPKYPPLTSADICRSYSPAAHHAGLRHPRGLPRWIVHLCSPSRRIVHPYDPPCRIAHPLGLPHRIVHPCGPSRRIAHPLGLPHRIVHPCGPSTPVPGLYDPFYICSKIYFLFPSETILVSLFYIFFAPKYISMKYIFYFLQKLF